MNQTLLRTVLRTACCAALALTGSLAGASCYTVYNGKGKIVQQTAKPPVDMRYPIRHTVPKKFGKGATMTVEAPVASTCLDYIPAAEKRGSKTSQDTDVLLDNLVQEHLERTGWAPPGQQ